ncbi:MAG TPA: GTP-binding protein [Candidatus Dormibacteraeota bacterium]|nr:GTP-binding protein [Candidatus Dormibacteraeota bacterium]
MGLPEKIRAIEEEMSRTQVHKHTEHHVGLLKAKLAKLKAEQERSQSSKRSGGGFELKKGGDCTVVLIGLPSVGKSTILNHLTNAKSRIAAYAFTTLTVVPGLLQYQGAKIQILDLPGIISGAATGTGRGRRVLSVAKNADLIMLILDVFQPDQMSTLIKELYEIGIRLNTRPPNVTVNRSSQGGLGITAACKLTHLTESTIRAILNVYKINHGSVIIREDIIDDQLIDVIAANRKYIPSIAVLNKIDLVNPKYVEEVKTRIGGDIIPISADQNVNLEELKRAIYDNLRLIKVYLKPRNGSPDFEEPLIITAGSTISDVCNKIHRNVVGEAKYALVSGNSVRFSPQRVGMDHIVQDRDIVTIIK